MNADQVRCAAALIDERRNMLAAADAVDCDREVSFQNWKSRPAGAAPSVGVFAFDDERGEWTHGGPAPVWINGRRLAEFLRAEVVSIERELLELGVAPD